MSAVDALRGRWSGLWSGLAPRDQRALRIGGVLLAVLLPLALAWMIREGLAERRAQFEETRSLAATAGRRIAARLGAGADVAAPVADPAALQTLILRAAERAGLASATTVEPAPGAGRVRLALRDAPFDAVTTLLGSLARWEGVTVVTAEVTRTQPGRVDATLVLRGP